MSGSVIIEGKLDLIQYVVVGRTVSGCVFSPCVPQAEFSEINLASYVNSGCMVDMQVNKGGTKVVR